MGDLVELVPVPVNSMPGNGQFFAVGAAEVTSPAYQNCFPYPIPKGLNKSRACKSGHRIALFVGMDYEKMKALMETTREGSSAQRKAEVKQFPTQDYRPDWKYLDHIKRERIAA